MNALHTIQQKLKAPKNQTNKFGGYNYRNCEDILEAVKPLLAETKSTLTLDDDISVHGPMVFVMATATLTDSEGKVIGTASAFARHAEEQKGMMDSQLTGATSSYARKYALNGLFLIDDTKDADATNDGTKIDKKAVATKSAKPVPKPEGKKELDWLNPGTPNWEYSLKRLREGVTIETIEKAFRLSKVNKNKLLNESKHETAPLSQSN